MIQTLLVIAFILIISAGVGRMLEQAARDIDLDPQQKQLSEEYKKMLKLRDSRRKRKTSKKKS